MCAWSQRFPGYDREGKDFDAETHKKYIFGGHVAEYMELLQEEDPERYQAQFAKLIAEDVEGDALEDLYTEAFEKIRGDPEFVKTEKQDKYEPRNPQHKKNLAERKATVAQKKAAMRAALLADGSDDESDDDE